MLPAYVLTALALLAFVLQLAVDRAPDIKDSHDNKAARRVLIAGLGMLAGWMVYRSWQGYPVHPVSALAVGLVLFAEVMFCVNRLFPDFRSAIQRTPLRECVGKECRRDA